MYSLPIHAFSATYQVKAPTSSERAERYRRRRIIAGVAMRCGKLELALQVHCEVACVLHSPRAARSPARNLGARGQLEWKPTSLRSFSAQEPAFSWHKVMNATEAATRDAKYINGQRCNRWSWNIQRMHARRHTHTHSQRERESLAFARTARRFGASNSCMRTGTPKDGIDSRRPPS